MHRFVGLHGELEVGCGGAVGVNKESGYDCGFGRGVVPGVVVGSALYFEFKLVFLHIFHFHCGERKCQAECLALEREIGRASCRERV